MTEMTKTFVCYHAHCADGFGAAWAAWLALGESAVYLPCAYGEPLRPEIEPHSTVYLVDFSYPLDVMLSLLAMLCDVTVLDHHATARETLEVLIKERGVRGEFSTNRSGAMMAWDHFFPRERPPMLLLYVQDRDLWHWKLPQSREVSAALATYPQDFVLWSQLAMAWERLKGEGAVALRMIQQQAKSLAKSARMESIEGHLVPVVNATTAISEVGEVLLEQYPDAPFAAMYADRGAKRIWSLRSRPGFDCSVVAKARGGGGHAQACGFEEVAK